MAGLAGVGNLWILHRIFGQQGHKHVGMGVTGFFASGNSRHVATDAVGKGMDGMGQVFVNHLMAYHTLLGAGSSGLELSRGDAQLMDVVAGGTGNAFLGM
jgi:hypothetical protein